jgi:hypothetical protein
MHGVQSAIWCISRSNQIILTLTSYFTNLLQELTEARGRWRLWLWFRWCRHKSGRRGGQKGDREPRGRLWDPCSVGFLCYTDAEWRRSNGPWCLVWHSSWGVRYDVARRREGSGGWQGTRAAEAGGGQRLVRQGGHGGGSSWGICAWAGPMGGGSGPGPTKIPNWILPNLKIRTKPNWFCSKSDLPRLKKFQVKCGFEVFQIRNNFPYRNFFRFEADFEWKFREVLGFEIQ